MCIIVCQICRTYCRLCHTRINFTNSCESIKCWTVFISHIVLSPKFLYRFSTHRSSCYHDDTRVPSNKTKKLHSSEFDTISPLFHQTEETHTQQHNLLHPLLLLAFPHMAPTPYRTRATSSNVISYNIWLCRKSRKLSQCK